MDNKQRYLIPFSRNQETHRELEKLVVTTETTTFFDWIDRWVKSDCLWPFPVGTSCCSIEYITSLSSSTYLRDDGPFEDFSAQNADLMIVSGTITNKYRPYLLDFYEAMGKDRWVLAIGSCAASGGPFPGYNTVKGVSELFPVDVYVPGCPPTSSAIVQGVELMKERVSKGIQAKNGVTLKLD